MTDTPGSSSRPRIGVLALTLDLYESLAPTLRTERETWVRRAVLPRLAEFADIEFEGAVFRRKDIGRVVSEYELRECDMVLVLLLTYSPSQVALSALKRTRLPILVWNTQELYAVDETFTGDDMTANHGVHGTQDLANVLLRAEVPFEYVTSHLEDAGATDEIRDFAAAAAAVRALANLRIGLLGYPFPGMGDFAVDTTDMVARLGCDWTQLPIEEFLLLARDAPEDGVGELVQTYRRLYDVAPDATDEDLDGTARAELAMRGLVKDHGLGAVTYQFTAFGDDERSPTLPFVAASRLMAEGIGFGGEGDLVAAAGSTFLNRLMPPASFTEIFTVDFGGNGLFLSHMGECNVAMARKDRKPALLVRPKPITRTRGRQLAIVTSFEPGPATLMALTLGPGHRWRLIAAPITVEDYGPLPGMAVPHSKVRTSGDVRQLLTAYAKAGGPHHNALCFGDARRRLHHAAALLGADYLEV